jgi:hypothetical protein
MPYPSSRAFAKALARTSAMGEVTFGSRASYACDVDTRAPPGDSSGMTRDECLRHLHSLSNWKEDAGALAQMERDVHTYLASLSNPDEKFSAMNDLSKAFKDQAPDTTRTSLMLARLEEILTKGG